MGAQIYIRPTGFIYGSAAAEAIAAGLALPLAGNAIAFAAAELIEGEPGASKTAFARAATLSAIGEPVIAELLERITAPRPAFAGLSLDRARLMGIVNVTPDSFSDGGQFAEADAATTRARDLVQQGADIVDIGGESTRPGSDFVPEEIERGRILPVLERLGGLGAPISVDTRKPGVMREAAAHGAAILNDVSALSFAEDSLATAVSLALPVILMHALGDPKTMQDNPHYDDVLLEVFDMLKGRIEAAEAAGIPRANIAADPGIGFGKTLEHNLALMRGLSLFHGLGVALVIGVSRKRFIGALTQTPEPTARVPGSLAGALTAAAQGVQVLRVHDVAETRQALTIWEAATGLHRA